VDYVGETAEETVRMVKEKDGEAIAVKADVSHWDDVNKASFRKQLHDDVT